MNEQQMKNSVLPGYVLLLALYSVSPETVGEVKIFDKESMKDQEPSGAVWHPGLNALLVVSDSGWVLSLQPDGGKFSFWKVDGNLEGVAIAGMDSDIVYLGTENPDSIKEFDLRTGSVTRTFDLNGALRPEDPNKGLEALTFVPSGSPEGGLFYVGMQQDGALYVFELPVRTSIASNSPRHVRTIKPVPKRDGLSGLHYHQGENILYAIYDKYDCLREMRMDGSLIAEWRLPKDHQEGIAVAGNDLYIAQDNGKVWRYDFSKIKRQNKKCKQTKE
ncbi:esterase-like activity of phytase family protein [Pseudomonadota bacterium]